MVRSCRNYLINEGAKWIVLVGWLAVNAGLFYSTFFYYYYGPQFYYLHQMLGYGLCLSRASAACINLNACIILLPMCRIVLRLIRSLSKVCRQCRRLLDKSKTFHIACGYMICAMSVLHCGAHAFNALNFCAYFNFQFPGINVAVSAEQSPIMIILTSVPGVTGVLMVTCLLVIAVTASRPLRRRSYRRFWKTHHLFILFYALLLLHACSGVLKYQTNIKEHIPGCYIDLNAKGSKANMTIVLPEPEMEPHPEQMIVHAEPMPEPEKTIRLRQPVPEGEPEKSHGAHHPIPEGEPTMHLEACVQTDPKFKACPTEAWMWLSVPLLLYTLERISRFVGSSGQPLEITRVVEHPHDVIEVEFYQKDFKAKPGQSIWLRCPDISYVECHPFTLTSIPTSEKPVFTIHMVALGDWTRRARDMMTSTCTDPSNSKEGFYQESVFSKTCVEDRGDAEQYTDNQGDQTPLHGHSRLDQTHFREEYCDPQKYAASQHAQVPQKQCCASQQRHTEHRVDSELDADNKHQHTPPTDHSRLNEADEDNDRGSHELHATNQYELSPPSENFTTGQMHAGDVSIQMENIHYTQNSLKKPKRGAFPKFYAYGPHGSAMEDIFRYEVSLCVAGGIGITPFAAVLSMILKQSKQAQKSKLRRIYLVWVCRSIRSFEWFVELINSVQQNLWDANKPDYLNVYLHVTGDSEDERQGLCPEKPQNLRRCRLRRGRPNLKELFKDLSRRHEGTPVGVFCCGPKSLNSSVRQQCFNCKGRGATFVFNKESF